METRVLDRDQALEFVTAILETLAPTAKLAVYRSNGTIIISPEHEQHELLAWAERIGDQYDDVFQRLSE